jgi:hypothetical protein
VVSAKVGDKALAVGKDGAVDLSVYSGHLSLCFRVEEYKP